MDLFVIDGHDLAQYLLFELSGGYVRELVVSKRIVEKFGVVLLDFMVLGEPDAEPQHHLSLVFVDLGVF